MHVLMGLGRNGTVEAGTGQILTLFLDRLFCQAHSFDRKLFFCEINDLKCRLSALSSLLFPFNR
jgi:hypothetical protein